MTAAAKSLRDRLIELLEPVVHDLDLALWELEYLPRSNGALLRLYIDVREAGLDEAGFDSAAADEGDVSESGITVEDCARVSHAVSDVLEVADPIPGHYTLEVSSPGLDRVLRTAAHFDRFVGEPVRIELSAAMNGRKRFSGRLLSSKQGEIAIDVDGSPVALPLTAIHKARLAPELA
jgi:ribosome maturation factor RimP